MTPSDNTLVEAVAAALSIEGEDFLDNCKSNAEAAVKTICTYSGLTVEVIEMIRRSEAVVVPSKFVIMACNDSPGYRLIISLTDFNLNTPIERREG